MTPDRSAGERWVVGYRPSRVRRRMPRRFWSARSSSPSFFAAQMNAQATTASVSMLTAAITIPRNVLTNRQLRFRRAGSSLAWAALSDFGDV